MITMLRRTAPTGQIGDQEFLPRGCGRHTAGKENKMRDVFMSTLLGLTILLPGCKSPEDHVSRAGEVQVARRGQVLRHVVLLKFKDSSTPEQIRRVVDGFLELPRKIDVIQGFEWGTDVSPEQRSEGFTHCFVLTFRNEAARDAYLSHPAHQDFVQTLRPHLDKVLVVDYWTRDAVTVSPAA